MKKENIMKISSVRSLMSFNERVLVLGNVDPSEIYTMDQLSEKLFFNKIFMDNTRELFQRFDCVDIIEEYVDGLTQYVRNVELITKKIEEIDPNTTIKRLDSFERRLISNINMKDQLISNFYLNKTIPTEFINDIIYYITIRDDEVIVVSYVDPRKSIYEKILSDSQIKCSNSSECTTYWKNDDVILSYVKSTYGNNSVAIKVTSTSNNRITKIEFHSEDGKKWEDPFVFPAIDCFIRLAPPGMLDDALIVSNQFLFIDDIKRIIESKIKHKPRVTKQENKLITLDDVFKGDILSEYPSTSFDQYLNFLSEASTSDKVGSIYLTLYRIGEDPRLFNILKNAMKHGINVHVNIELNASGEKINQFWADEMRAENMWITTDSKYKVHCKLTLIQLKDFRQICQIGTGNYHTQTTTQYTDLSLMTSNSDICHQVARVFSVLDGWSVQIPFNNNLLLTQFNMRKELISLIKKQGALGSAGYIGIKCNSIDDKEINEHLCAAAKKGCKMSFIVRGVCTFVPDEIGKNVSIKSVIWDKLEHSRIYWFGKEEPTIYIGSLDLVTHKMDKRIETLVRIQDPKIVKRISEYMNQYVTNSQHSWVLTSSGDYKKE